MGFLKHSSHHQPKIQKGQATSCVWGAPAKEGFNHFLDVPWLFSLPLLSVHTALILAARIFLAIHFLRTISIISILFCFLSSSSHYNSQLKRNRSINYCWAQHHRNIYIFTQEISFAVLRRVQESKEGEKGNKGLLWRNTQACTGQKWWFNLQCFAEKPWITRKYHTAHGFANMHQHWTMCITARQVWMRNF